MFTYLFGIVGFNRSVKNGTANVCDNFFKLIVASDRYLMHVEISKLIAVKDRYLGGVQVSKLIFTNDRYRVRVENSKLIDTKHYQ